MKMTVLYVKDTGHVMAAVTRNAPVEPVPADPAADRPAPEVSALVGDALPVRGFIDFSTGLFGPAAFTVPADRLVALEVDRDDDQLLAPHDYTVLDGKKLEVSPPTPLPTLSAPSSNTVRVSLPAATLSDLPLQLYLAPRLGATGSAQSFEGVFKPATATSTTLDFGVRTAMAGDYDLLMLLRGYRVATIHLHVP